MSYQYPYIEHYSPTPATPLDAFHPPWDAQDDPAQLAASFAQSPIHQQESDAVQSQSQPSIVALAQPASSASGHKYEFPQVIQLVERPQRRARQQKQPTQSQAQAQNQPQAQTQAQTQSSHPSPNLSTKAQTPTEPTGMQQQLTSQSHSGASPAPGQWFDLHELAKAKVDKNQRPTTATARAQARLAAHPYQRRSVSGPGSLQANANAKTRRQVASSTIMAGGNITSPTQKASPTSLTTTSPTTSTSEPRRYLIRTDVHFSAATNTLTAMLELPGVKRAQVHVSLCVCPRSGATQLIVRGCSQRIFPENVGGENGAGKVEGYMVRERKCGEFKRVLVVPPETKPDHIQTSMEDGILFVSYPAGVQMQQIKDDSTSAN